MTDFFYLKLQYQITIIIHEGFEKQQKSET